MVALIILAVILLIVFLPVGVRLKYENGVLDAWYTVLCFRKVWDLSLDKEDKSTSKTLETARELLQQEPDSTTKDFFIGLGLILNFLNDLRKKLRIRRLEMNLVLAGDDPCDLGISYGRAWAALGNLMPQLERVLRIRKRDLRIGCDFAAEKTTLYFYADAKLFLAEYVYLLLQYSFRVAKIKETRGAKHE